MGRVQSGQLGITISLLVVVFKYSVSFKLLVHLHITADGNGLASRARCISIGPVEPS